MAKLTQKDIDRIHYLDGIGMSRKDIASKFDVSPSWIALILNPHRADEQRERNRIYYEKNRERILVQSRGLYLRDREAKIKKSKAYNKKNRARILLEKKLNPQRQPGYFKKYYQANRAKLLARRRERYAKFKK